MLEVLGLIVAVIVGYLLGVMLETTPRPTIDTERLACRLEEVAAEHCGTELCAECLTIANRLRRP